MSRRREVIDQIHGHLSALSGTARISWKRKGPHALSRGQRFWPADTDGRRAVWREVETAFEVEARALVVTVWADDTDHAAAVPFDVPGTQESLYEETQEAVGVVQPENHYPLRVLTLEESPEALREPPPPEPAAPSPPKASSRFSEGCARDVLELLYDVQERRTAEEMEQAFATAHESGGGVWSWSLSTVRATVAQLRRQGVIDNKRDGKGSGYGLIAWDTDPCPSE